MTQPLVSVIMPAYNAEKYIAEAIESVMNQTYNHYELIIINDNSSDQTQQVIDKYAKSNPKIISLSNSENLKLSHTLNRGIKIAQGKYVARVDADDRSFPDRIEKQVVFMERNPEIGISGGTMEIIDEKGELIGERRYNLTDKNIRRKIFRYSPFCHPSVIIRKDVLELSGDYNSNFNPAEDYELYFRIGLHSKFANLRDKLIQYRVVTSSMTSSQLREMEFQTIKARRMNYQSYRATVLDRIYTNLLQVTVIFPFISAQNKLWLFTKIRKFL